MDSEQSGSFCIECQNPPVKLAIKEAMQSPPEIFPTLSRGHDPKPKLHFGHSDGGKIEIQRILQIQPGHHLLTRFVPQYFGYDIGVQDDHGISIG